MKTDTNASEWMAYLFTLTFCVMTSGAAATSVTRPKALTYNERMDLIGEVMGTLRDKATVPALNMAALNKAGGEYDGATLYSLAVVTVKCEGDHAAWRKSGQYMLQSAEKGCPAAEVAVAIKLHSRLSGDWSADYIEELRCMSIYEALETAERKAHYTDIAREFYNKAIAHGFPCLTNMLVVLDSELQDSREAELARLENERISKELKLAELRRAGRTSSFVLFNELGRMDYLVAVAKAKQNDPQAYYWLSYYFGKGEGVAKNGKSAWRCLAKAASLGSPEANYAKGLFYEQRAFPLPNDDFLGMFGNDFAFDVDKWGCDVNNNDEVSCVEELYNRAAAGGLTFATNDLARFRKKISVKRAEIAAAKALECDAGNVLKTLALEEQEDEERNRKTEKERRDREFAETSEALKIATEEEEKRKKDEADRLADVEFWETWPKEVSLFDKDIRQASDNENGVVIDIGTTNCSWSAGSGKALISTSVRWQDRGTPWRKYDEDGNLVKVGPKESFGEYDWLTNRANRITVARRTAWAEEHGMSYEEASKKYDAYLNKWYKPLRCGLSLRDRRFQQEQQHLSKIEQLQKCKAMASSPVETGKGRGSK